MSIRESNEMFLNDLKAAFAGLRILDDTPIMNVHSAGWDAGGKTFSVYCDMADGGTRIFSFTPGKPACVTDH